MCPLTKTWIYYADKRVDQWEKQYISHSTLQWQKPVLCTRSLPPLLLYMSMAWCSDSFTYWIKRDYVSNWVGWVTLLSLLNPTYYITSLACIRWYSMNVAMPARRHSGLVKRNEMYASLSPTSGTINAKPTTSFLYSTTQLKSGYCRHSVTAHIHTQNKFCKSHEKRQY